MRHGAAGAAARIPWSAPAIGRWDNVLKRDVAHFGGTAAPASVERYRRGAAGEIGAGGIVERETVYTQAREQEPDRGEAPD
ncbi:hypothetical protein, partial [Klebsiella michiganensis]|uniref:hypothetical protein n=1 Tax=Klebsiella michiganensis TaxID=1134687 RepID=UPI0013CFBC40